MRNIIALSVLACLAASPAFAWGTGAGTGTGAGDSNGGVGIGTGTGTGSTGDHGEADARGFVGGIYEGQTQGMRWDDELGCIEGTLTRCNK